MKHQQSKLKPLMCTALLVANLTNPTYFYANEANDANEVSVEEASTVESVEEMNASEVSGEDLNKSKEHTIHAINTDSFGDLPTKEKYINQINQAQTVAEVNAIFAEFNKQKQNAIREEFQKKIEEAIHRARTTPGFILVDNHDAYIQLIQNAASEDEIENHLRELKQKADAALAINDKQKALSDHIRNNYKYLGERLGDYNLFVENQKTDAELEKLRQQAETEHKGIVLKLLDQTVQRLQSKMEELKALPELDASNPDYNNQRKSWDFALSEIPKAIAFVKEVKKRDNAQIVDFYESGMLFWEIYANIEHLSRKAVTYAKEFPNSAELAQKVKELIYADGNPYSTIDGAQEIPVPGRLREFYNNDILKKYQEIEQLYSQLKADVKSSESSSDISSESQPESSSSMSSESQSAPQSESSSSMSSESQSAPQSESSSSMSSESQSAPQSESSSSMSSESQSAPQSESSSSMSSISTNKTSSQITSKNKQNTKELVKAGEALNVVSVMGILAIVMSSLLWITRSKKINN